MPRSRAVGAAALVIIAGLSVTSRTEMLAVVLGALFVAEVTSVVVQIMAFRTTGRRVFRMAPFHQPLRAVGRAETTGSRRCWALTALPAWSAAAPPSHWPAPAHAGPLPRHPGGGGGPRSRA